MVLPDMFSPGFGLRQIHTARDSILLLDKLAVD
jgi:hypothetical protein